MNAVKLFLFLITSIFCFAQENSNPIVFADLIIGYSNGSSKGMTGGASINYQTKNNLFTYRFIEVSEIRYEGILIFIPILTTVETIKENAFLFGKRIVEDNMSYSYSVGISYVEREFLVDSSNNVLRYDSSENIGLPFEFNIKWFNSKKERYRIYQLIPVGNPTSFANSIGFKFYGSISKTSFFGVGITFGLGWHKNY